MCGGPSGSTLSVCYFCLVTSRNVTETQDKLLYHCLPYFLALSFIIEVTVWYFVSETQKVMTALILIVSGLLWFSQNCCYICLFTSHFWWSFSLQSHWSLFVYFYVNWLAVNISLKCDTEGFDSLFFLQAPENDIGKNSFAIQKVVPWVLGNAWALSFIWDSSKTWGTIFLCLPYPTLYSLHVLSS